MYKVIVIDDEFTAVEHICTIIELKCPEFVVVDTADNGQEGLEKIREKRPDLVITDIKMPIINGIELVGRLKDEFPEIFSIIVSGYQDFDYAKSAIKSGVCDYLLKPVTPTNLKAVLETVKVKLADIYYRKRDDYVKKMAKGENLDDDILQEFFPGKAYYAAIMRRNGLPRRFGVSNIEMFSIENEKILIYGRDEMEALYLVPEELLFQKSFPEMIEGIQEKFGEGNHYLTTILLEQPYPASVLSEKIKLLYRILDTQTVIGLTQTLLYNEQKGLSKQYASASAPSQNELNELEFIIKEQKFEKLETVIKELLLDWNEKRYPQLVIERMIRHIFYIIEKYIPDFSVQSCEFLLDDAFFYVSDIQDLIDNVLSILSKDVLGKESNGFKSDTPEFFQRITEYIEANRAEQLSLQSICKVFGISQPSLSKLFKKYKNTSFNNYLTYIRIEYAKKIMERDKDIFVKDVASMAGYNDQFYFSRIFRSVTGKSPSEYIENCTGACAER